MLNKDFKRRRKLGYKAFSFYIDRENLTSDTIGYVFLECLKTVYLKIILLNGMDMIVFQFPAD